MSDDEGNTYMWMPGHSVYTFVASTTSTAVTGDTSPSEMSPDPIETEEQKRERLWQAIVDAAKGNG